MPSVTSSACPAYDEPVQAAQGIFVLVPSYGARTMMTPADSYDVRAELEERVERDLLGPRDGPHEELMPPGTPPAERYLVGRLVARARATRCPRSTTRPRAS